MKLRSLLIYLLLLISLIPAWYIHLSLQKVLKPRDSAVRLFLYFLANFLLVIIYTILIVGLVVYLQKIHLCRTTY